jgi:hypothetical protein
MRAVKRIDIDQSCRLAIRCAERFRTPTGGRRIRPAAWLPHATYIRRLRHRLSYQLIVLFRQHPATAGKHIATLAYSKTTEPVEFSLLSRRYDSGKNRSDIKYDNRAMSRFPALDRDAYRAEPAIQTIFGGSKQIFRTRATMLRSLFPRRIAESCFWTSFLDLP